MIDLIRDLYHNPAYHPYFLLFFAAFCGGALGVERQIAGHKEAGRRTLALVSLGACLFSILPMMSGVADPWRMGGQVVTGIGFLGGGVLLRNNSSEKGLTTKGLTTASAIWVSAAIGICFAANQVVMGFFCCVFTFLILRIKKDPKEYLSEINNLIDNNVVEKN